MGVVELAGLWERWRDELPEIQEQPTLPPVAIESFEPGPTPFSFQFTTEVSLPRLWFLAPGGGTLVQVQRDRLVHNWRQTAADQPYPRYAHFRPIFADRLSDLVDHLEKHDMGKLQPVQCEVTYINHIPLDTVPNRTLAGVLAPWSETNSDQFLPGPEDVRATVRYQIPGPGGTPVGRLYVSADPVWATVPGHPPSEVLLLQLFCRGRPLGPGIGGVLDFCDLAHEWIVRGFASITTPEMHTVWRRKVV